MWPFQLITCNPLPNWRVSILYFRNLHLFIWVHMCVCVHICISACTCECRCVCAQVFEDSHLFFPQNTDSILWFHSYRAYVLLSSLHKTQTSECDPGGVLLHFSCSVPHNVLLSLCVLCPLQPWVFVSEKKNQVQGCWLGKTPGQPVR